MCHLYTTWVLEQKFASRTFTPGLPLSHVPPPASITLVIVADPTKLAGVCYFWFLRLSGFVCFGRLLVHFCSLFTCKDRITGILAWCYMWHLITRPSLTVCDSCFIAPQSAMAPKGNLTMNTSCLYLVNQ